MTDRLVLAHGFTQTARSWATIKRLLAEHQFDSVTAFDMPGHGSNTERLDLWASATKLVQQGGPATYVGYSMGGRVALHAALSHPASVQRLILIGATAGIEDNSERAQRRATDNALAQRIAKIGLERFLDEWLALPLFAGLTAETDQRADRLRNTPAGLADSLRLTGSGTQQPLWDRLEEIAVPVLLLAGERDLKFESIGMRMQSLLPNASFMTIADAGHSVHLEQPEETVNAITRWLDQQT